MTKAKTWAVALLGAVLTTSTMSGQTPDPKLVDAGRKAFNSKTWDCVKCHSAEGVGNKKLPMERLNKMDPADIRKWITSPAEMTAKLPKKPAVPMKKQDIPAAEVDALVAFVHSVQK
jgi:hypothetical protein